MQEVVELKEEELEGKKKRKRRGSEGTDLSWH